MMEGWVHDPKCDAINVGRLLGTADSLRAVAEVAGPKWRPAPQEQLSLAPFLASSSRAVPLSPSAWSAEEAILGRALARASRSRSALAWSGGLSVAGPQEP